MRIKTVAIIGRPNVGKSTLFNAFVKKRKAIVSDIPGTTRDNLIEKIVHKKQSFFLVDTAGLTSDAGEKLEEKIQTQARLAAQNADMILFLVDGRSEITKGDHDVANYLRKLGTKVVLAVNKIDDKNESLIWNFVSLGLGDPVAISAKNRIGLRDLVAQFPTAQVDKSGEITQKSSIKIAIIGRPNSGKSSLLNSLSGKNLSLVSDASGTTRDRVDTFVSDKENNKYQLIDTAGLKKSGKIGRDFDFWSSVRTAQAIEEADICVCLIDALVGVAHADLVIIGRAIGAGKGIILGVNKFDLVLARARGKDTPENKEIPEVAMWNEKVDSIKQNYLRYLSTKLAFASWAPVIFFSAKTGKGTREIFDSAKNIQLCRRFRIQTSVLNKFLPEVMHSHVLPSQGNRTGKIKFIQQVSVSPPEFKITINSRKAFHHSYWKFIENNLRKKFGFIGTPLILEFSETFQRNRKNK